MSQEASDLFADLLGPGETVAATVAGPDVSRPNGARVWLQLALTDAGAGSAGQRLLAVVLVQAPHGGAWQPVSRFAAYSHQVRLARYPRTPSSAARLEVLGFAEPVMIVDIDDPSVFPHVEPFLGVWQGPIEGAGVVHERELEADESVSVADPLRIMAVAGVLFTLMALCCGCSGLISAVVSLVGSA